MSETFSFFAFIVCFWESAGLGSGWLGLGLVLEPGLGWAGLWGLGLGWKPGLGWFFAFFLASRGGWAELGSLRFGFGLGLGQLGAGARVGAGGFGAEGWELAIC